MMHKALKQFGFMVNFDEVVLEGYLVLNPDSKVAKLTQSNTNIDIEDVETVLNSQDTTYHTTYHNE